MDNDAIVMKTTLFGGFKKSDVLSYVENLQTEIADVKNMLDDKRKEALELRNKVDELNDKLEILSDVNEKLAIKENENKELSEKLSITLQEKEDAITKLNEYEKKADKIKKAEKQIGAAYLDARRYSDELVDDAKMRAKDIGAIASQSVKREANEIEELLRDVDSLSKKFSSSLEQLHKDVYSLSSKLNSSASNLLNLHTDIAGLDGEVVKIDELPDDAVSVEKTSDDSGLTYILYEPKSEFNEDLNIKPENE